MTIVLTTAWVTGRWAARALGWRGETWRETGAFTIALGFVAISFGSFALAAFGLYRPFAVGGIIAVIMLVAGRAALKGCATYVAQGFSPARAAWGFNDPRANAGERWAKASVALAMLVAFWAALAPESEFDALWYHLELPRQWLRQGGPIDRIEDYVSLVTPMLSSPAATARVRIEWTNASTVAGVNPTNFRVEPPFVAVTKPDGPSHNWSVGTSQTITWTNNLGTGESVKVELSTDGGTTYGYLLFGSTTSDGSQSTTVLSDWKTETARLRITWLKNAAVSDASNELFAIR